MAYDSRQSMGENAYKCFNKGKSGGNRREYCGGRVRGTACGCYREIEIRQTDLFLLVIRAEHECSLGYVVGEHLFIALRDGDYYLSEHYTVSLNNLDF